MEALIQSLVAWLGISRYFLFFFGAFFEGPVVMLSGGFLYRLGQAELPPLYAALVLGDFVADICWYFAGRYGGRRVILRWGKIFRITPELVDLAEDRFHKYHQKILIISKLTMGFGFAVPVLATAGMLRVPLKDYALLNFFGGLLWVAFLVMVGYFFGNIYYLVPEKAKLAFSGGILVAAILTLRYVSNRFKTIKI